VFFIYLILFLFYLHTRSFANFDAGQIKKPEKVLAFSGRKESFPIAGNVVWTYYKKSLF